MMIKSATNCDIKTNKDKNWPYVEYYIGEKDKDKRKNAQLGQHFWSGAKSLESYNGAFLRDTMHGLGVYRWRHYGTDGTSATYEGHFYNNSMHGYGTMSYHDGRVFNGLYYENVRWGPGVESHPVLRENVGLWRGNQLVRLVWRPLTPSITPDFLTAPNGKKFISPFRVKLTGVIKNIGEINSAIDLLKQSGSSPVAASENWTKLYPKHCTDMNSQFCYKEAFEQDYYKGKIYTLEEVTPVSDSVQSDINVTNNESTDSFPNVGTFYAWNNNKMIIHMMNHCYKHETQRNKSAIALMEILSGPRDYYKPAAKHELDCRILIMASYLGHIMNVAQLINECNVNPNIADIQGNTALFYATCGDEADVIHFLVEAGADVNSYNDACCTPLGVALMRFACILNDIPPNGMTQALLPQELSVELTEYNQVCDWIIMRDFPLITPNVLPRTPSKSNATKSGLAAVASNKKLKMSISQEMMKKKIETVAQKSVAQKSVDISENESDEAFSQEKQMYNSILHEYFIKVNDIFLLPNPVNVPYIFQIDDLGKMIDANEDDKKLPDKASKKMISKVIKPSKDMMWKSSEKEVTTLDSIEKIKIEKVSRTMMTILQLLTDGANPRLVRFPQPALFMAAVSGSADLLRHLINHGADVNEVYPQALGYTVLEVMISRSFTYDNLELIRALLECGAKAVRRLPYTVQGQTQPDSNASEVPGPTLLHAILAKKAENEIEEDVRQQVIELLLEYGCDASIQFRGRSALDIAMSKGMDILDIFIRCPRVNLNAIINESNQTILVKMFTMSFCKTVPSSLRLQTLTNLLLFGADPLIKCQNREEKYENIFVFAKKEIESVPLKPTSPSAGNKADPKAKKSDKFKKDDKLTVKSSGKVVADEVSDYKQALDLVTECARMLHIRWVQANLMKALIDTVDKFKHRHWSMILKEIKNEKCTGLWLNAVRCIEIWDKLKCTKRRKYNDSKILRHVLCIVHYYFRNSKNILRNRQLLTAAEKETIESEVNYFLREHKMATVLSPEIVPWKRTYVTPELTTREVQKFKVCFECAMPFNEQKLICPFCKLLAFCSYNCMKINIVRINCHPCSDFLQKKYFPANSDSLTSLNTT